MSKDRPRIVPRDLRYVRKNAMNPRPEASEPAHISAEELNKTKTQTTKTHHISKPSNRSEPKVLKHCAIVKGCSEAAANAKKGGVGANLQKPTRQRTLQRRELQNENQTAKPNKPARQQADQKITKPPGQQPGSLRQPKGPAARAKP